MTEAAAVIHNNLEALRDRKGVSILDLWELFPDDDHAEAWLCWARWGGNIRCVDCGSENSGKEANKHVWLRSGWRCFWQRERQMLTSADPVVAPDSG